VFAPELTESFAAVLRALGSKRAFIVHGRDGLDEITVTTTNASRELRNGRLAVRAGPAPAHRRLSFSGFPAGRSPEANAAITRRVLAGESGAARDIVLLNAARHYRRRESR